MGVQGLWQLLATLGSPVPLESFENKVLSVDISIWLNQVLKGYKDAHGRSVNNAHLLGLFHRLCKLLFYKIKPIIVFDGGIPQLKRQTLAERQRRKEVAQQKSNKAQLKICANYLASQFFQSKTKRKIISDIPKSQTTISDLYELAPLPEKDVGSISEDDNAIIEMDSEGEFEEHQDLKNVNIESEDFQSLPYEIKQEILVSMRENRKRKWTAIELFPDESSDFSKYQLKNLLENRNLQQKITKVEKEMNRVASSQTYLHYLNKERNDDHSFEMKKIASEDFSHFILMKKLDRSPHKDLPTSESVSLKHEEKDVYRRNCKLETSFNHKSVLQNPTESGKLVSKNSHQSFKKSVSSDIEVCTLNDYGAECYNYLEKEISSCNKSSLSGTKEQSCIKNYTLLLENNEAESETVVKQFEERTIVESGTESEVNKFIPKTETNVISSTFHDQTYININTSETCTSKSSFECIGNLPNQDSLPLNNIRSDVTTKSELFTAEKDSKSDLSINSEINITPFNQKKNILLQTSTEKIPPKDTSNEPDIMHLHQSSNKLLANNILIAHDITSEIDMNVMHSTNVPLPKTVESIDKQGDACCDVQKNNHDKLYQPLSSLLPSCKDSLLVEHSSDKKESLLLESTFIDANANNLNASISLSENVSSANESMDMLVDSTPFELESLYESCHDKLKQETISLQIESAQQQRIASTVTEQMYEEIKELLHLFGIPYIVSPMEAEAQCAFFDYNDLTDGTITDDSDIWLFGGCRVYRNFFQMKKYVEFFKASEMLSHFGLTRQKLINFAILTGCDYSPGIEGVGPVTAVEILNEFQGDGLDPLYKLKSWWESSKKHSTTPKNKTRAKLQNLNLPSDFPNQSVYDAYFNPEVNVSKKPFSWSIPDLDGLREFSINKFGWNKTKVDGILLPVMKRIGERQANIEKFFNVQLKKHENLFPNKRIQNAVRHLNIKSSMTKKATSRRTATSDSNKQNLRLKKGERKCLRQKKHELLEKTLMSNLINPSSEVKSSMQFMVDLSEESSSESD